LLKKYIVTVIAIVSLTSVFAQTSDTLTQKKKVKFIFGLDANRSFVLKNNTKFWGLRIGVQLKDKHKLGLGLYGMQKPVILEQELNKNKYPHSNDSLFFNFRYNSLFYEYIWYKTKRWEMSTPIHLGGGEVNLSYRDTLMNVNKPLFMGNTSIFVASGAAQYKITRWLALGVGIGYRFVFSRDEHLMKGLNAPIYVYRAKLLVGELYRMWFKKNYYDPDWD
jgi:hypothetical protein